jgi:hypothetical protein
VQGAIAMPRIHFKLDFRSLASALFDVGRALLFLWVLKLIILN